MSLQDRYNSLQQTRANNANPKQRIFVRRQKVPIINDDYYTLTEIDDSTYGRVSSAVSRPDISKAAHTAYIAGITGGDARIYSSPLEKGKATSTSTLETTINNVSDIALAFQGTFTEVKKTNRIELETGILFIFWIDALDDVYVRQGINGSDIQIASSAVAIDAVMGIQSELGNTTQGMILSYCTTAGIVFTRQYANSGWQVANQVGNAPADIIDLAFNRTWDFRLALQLQDNTNGLYQMLTKAVASGFALIETFEMSKVEVGIDVGQLATVAGYGDEAVEVSNVDVLTNTGYTEAPTIISAINLNNGFGNYGLNMRVVFDTDITNITDLLAWTIVDDNVVSFAAGEINRTAGTFNSLDITFANFNNAVNPVSIDYNSALGNITDFGEFVAVQNESFEFTAINLVPFTGAYFVSAVVIDNTNIIITFNEDMAAITDQPTAIAAFDIIGQEPVFSPDGEILPNEYTISTITNNVDLTKIDIVLTEVNRIKHPQQDIDIGYDGTGLLSGTISGVVSAFDGTADISGASIDIFFNPADNENIEVDVNVSLPVGQIVQRKGYSDEATEMTDVQVSLEVGHIEDIPT